MRMRLDLIICKITREEFWDSILHIYVKKKRGYIVNSNQVLNNRRKMKNRFSVNQFWAKRKVCSLRIYFFSLPVRELSDSQEDNRSTVSDLLFFLLAKLCLVTHLSAAVRLPTYLAFMLYPYLLVLITVFQAWYLCVISSHKNFVTRCVPEKACPLLIAYDRIFFIYL